MIYNNITQGLFRVRPNRFIAHVEVNDKEVIAHVKNTGRCKELLIPGTKVILQNSDNPSRKTAYDLIAVWKGDRLINMDSSAPNKVFLELLKSGQDKFGQHESGQHKLEQHKLGQYMEDITLIKPEAKYGDSRFDFYVEAGKRKIFIEVKGVTLEENNVALFPDAPTQRGVRHLNELVRSLGDEYEAHVVFVVQMSNVHSFAPNNSTHPAFGEALIAAQKAGVKIAAFDCLVTENSLNIGNHVPVIL
jgi:sugar fermentation stimulation protein A